MRFLKDTYNFHDKNQEIISTENFLSVLQDVDLSAVILILQDTFLEPVVKLHCKELLADSKLLNK